MPRPLQLLTPLLLCVLAAAAAGCDDAATPGDARRIETATRAGEQVPGLWRPAAVAVDSQGRRAWVAELATRRVRAVDLETGAMQTVLDVEPRPDVPSIAELEVRWDLGWGRALTWLTDGDLLLAGVGRPLVVLDPLGAGDPVVLGRGRDSATPGRAPAPGVRLDEVDLSTLQGLAIIDGRDEVVVLLGARLWRVAPTSSTGTSAERLAGAILEPLAGNGRRDAGPHAADALEVPLDLLPGRWEAILAHPDGRVFFVETNRLRLVSQGRIVSVTPGGSKTGLVPLQLDELAPMFTSTAFSTGVWLGDAPGFVDGLVLRRFDIESVDLDTGAVQGQAVALNAGVPELGGAAATADGRVWTTFGLGGALIELVDDDPSDEDTVRRLSSVVGPTQSYTERYFFQTPDYAPWRLDGFVLPQAVVTLGDGELLFVNQPLARLMSVVDRRIEPGVVPPASAPMIDPDDGSVAGSSCIAPADALASCAYWADAKGNSLGLGPSATDGRQFLYSVFRGELRAVDTLSTDVDRLVRVVTTTRAPVASGIPAPATDVALLTPVELLADRSDIVLALTAAVARLELDTGRIEHETGRSSGLSPLTDERVPLFALDLRARVAMDVGGDGLRLVALEDPQLPGMLVAAGSLREPAAVAGVAVDRNAYHRVAGGGAAALVEGTAALDVWFEAVDAVALVERPDDAHGVLAGVHGRDAAGQDLTRLVEIGADGLIDVLERCAEPPAPLDWLHPVLADDGSLVAVLGHERAGALVGCRVSDEGAAAVTVGSDVLTPDTWTTLENSATPFDPSVSGGTLVHYQDFRGLPVVWMRAIAVGGEPVAARRVDLALGARERVESITVNEEGGRLVVAVDGPDGRLLLEGRLPGHDDDTRLSGLPALPVLQWIGGGGPGLASGERVSATAMGDSLAAMAVGADGALLVVSDDTQSVWRIDAGDDGADANDPAHLLWMGPPIFRADDDGATQHPLATGADGEIWVGGRDGVYELVAGQAPRRVIGGSGALFEGGPANDTAIGPVLGLAAEGSTCYVLTDRALLAVHRPGSEDARIQLLSRDGALEVDGERWPLAARVVTQPVLSVGRPDELLLVVPGRHTVVSVSTAGLER